jgi:hypothetical protein
MGDADRDADGMHVRAGDWDGHTWGTWPCTEAGDSSSSSSIQAWRYNVVHKQQAPDGRSNAGHLGSTGDCQHWTIGPDQ